MDNLSLDQIISCPGSSSPLGFSIQQDQGNFSLFSPHATQAVLGLKLQGKIREIPMQKTGDFWHAAITPCNEALEYAFRLNGPCDVNKGHLFSSNIWLADPTARYPSNPFEWGNPQKSVWSQCRRPPPFDWQGIKKPGIPLSELIIYEMHVRGFTRHSSSKVPHPGKFSGIIDKIPYLKKLGINAVELMPIFEFDETHCQNKNPETNAPLVNYWGYNPLYFFAPMRRYASSDVVNEFRTLVRELHKAGIEVILDVVYNHTGEGKELSYVRHFRGLDNATYYMVDGQGHYRDFTGCGNTVNSNHPVLSELILESLRYWVEEMQVDGFRFDLAAVHVRGTDGRPMKDPPLLKAIASDPVFQKTKFIAEGWDATGLYMVGSFPDFGPWSVWNGKFRDKVRNFIKGTNGAAGQFADVISGSEFLYGKHTPQCSINFVTAHDGFNLADLVSYQQKHNFSNGEGGRDGNDHPISWNCGVEGPTDSPEIHHLREKQMRNFFLALFLAQGVPMLLMGDEYGHTRQGNNNPYVHDNELNWFLWDKLARNQDIFDFVSSLIAFRKNHPELRQTRFLEDQDVSWHGQKLNQPNWDEQSRLVAYMLNAASPLYIAFNAKEEAVQLQLPSGSWQKLINTEQPWKDHFLKTPQKAPVISNSITLSPYSAILLQKT